MPERPFLSAIHDATRSAARITALLAVARLLVPLLRAMDAVRIAVHPGDTRLPEIMASVDKAVGELIKTHCAARHGDLKVAGRVACAC
jgi:hypothetical protein